jgi:hypothetical protein
MPDTPALSQYGYNKAARRYVDLRTGQFVAATAIRQAVDAVIDTETSTVRDLSQQLLNGQLTLAQWQSQMQATLKTLYVAIGVCAGGGFATMSQSDYGYLGSLIKVQYQYLRTFASEIASGKQPLDGSLLARAALYAQAARGIFYAMATELAKEAGCTQERRMLGVADHCAGCVTQAAKGWQPIGSLAPIGATECLSNCRCSKQFK